MVLFAINNSLRHCERPTEAWQSIGIDKNDETKLFDVFQTALS
jgi:hypothetical protein